MQWLLCGPLIIKVCVHRYIASELLYAAQIKRHEIWD